MASNTDTIHLETDHVETGGATREASRLHRNRRGALTWVAVFGAGVAVAALAVATISGGDHGANVPATRFDPQAEVYEQRAHLEGQARTYGHRPAAAPNPAQAAQLAEREERQAHLDGQARTHSRPPAASSDTTTTSADTPEHEQLP